MTGLSRRAKYGLIHTDRDADDDLPPGHERALADRSRQHPKRTITWLSKPARHRFALNDPRRFGSVDLGRRRRTRQTGRNSQRWAPSRWVTALTADWLRRAIAGAQAGDQAAAARPAHRRRARQYLCLRGTVARADRPSQAGGARHPAAARATGPGDSRRARCNRSRRAARPCATSPSPTASSAISPHAFDVYGREGEPCRREDGGTIAAHASRAGAAPGSARAASDSGARA